MKLFFIIIAGFLGCSIGAKKKKGAADIKAVRLSRNFPNFDISEVKAKIIGYDTSEIRIFKYRNQLLYQEFFYSTTINIRDSSEKKEYKNQCFVFSEGQSLGLFYDSSKHIYNKVVSVDSMLNKMWCYKFEASDYIEAYDSKFVSSLTNKITGDIEELYAYRDKEDTSMSGNIIFSFSNKPIFKKIEYSFSKNLDKKKGWKLYKVTVTTKGRTIPKYKFYMDKAEIYYMLEKYNIENSENVYKYFEEEDKFRKFSQ